MLHGRNINLSKDVSRTEGDVNGTGGHRHLIHERGAQVISCLVCLFLFGTLRMTQSIALCTFVVGS